MKTVRLCPECGEPLKVNGKCLCGWMMPSMATHERRCAYRAGLLRCEEQGRICTHPYADGPWFCRYHWLVYSDEDKPVDSWRQAEQVNNHEPRGK